MKTKLTEEEATKMYDEMLHESRTDWIKNFDGAKAYKELDPIAYDCGWNDYIDGLTEEYIIEGLNDNESEE